MGYFHTFPFAFFGGVIPLLVFIGIVYLVFKWGNKIISLKEEQNDLLKDIIDRMEKR